MRRPIIGLICNERAEGAIRYLPEGYLNGVHAAGGEPRAIDYMDFSLDEIEDLADALDGIVLTGGRDVEPARYGRAPWPELGPVRLERDALEIPLIRAMLARKKPMLGICRGLQVVNVALGGTLVQHVPKVYGKSHQQAEGGPPFAHEVDIVSGSRTAEIFGTATLLTNSYHHQSAEEVAPGLVISGRSRDGVVEALEWTGDSFLICLQWHPEKTLELDEHSIKPFRALLAEAR